MKTHIKTFIAALCIGGLCLSCSKTDAELDGIEKDIEQNRALSQAQQAMIAGAVASLETAADALDARISVLEAGGEGGAGNLAALKDKTSEVRDGIAALTGPESTMTAARGALDAIALLLAEIETDLATLPQDDSDIAAIIAAAKEKTEEAIAALEGKLDDFAKIIQSVTFVPDYRGGFAVAERDSAFHDLDMNFRISPAAAADSIVSNPEAVILECRCVSDTIPLENQFSRWPIAAVTASDEAGIITVSISSSVLDSLSEQILAEKVSLTLHIASGNTDIATSPIGLRSTKAEPKISALSDEAAEIKLNDIYRDLTVLIALGDKGYSPYQVCFNLCGDDIYAAGEDFDADDPFIQLNEFRHTPDNEIIHDCYHALQDGIECCNSFIRTFNVHTDTTGRQIVTAGADTVDATGFMKQGFAEARTLRAWLTFMLGAGWGTPHITIPNPRLAYRQDSIVKFQAQKELYNWCTRECQEAISDLPERQSQADKQGAYRAIKGFAMAIAGKAALFAQDYQTALKMFKEIINCWKYALVPGERYADLFHTEGNGCEEKIFEFDLARYEPFGACDNDFRAHLGQDVTWAWRYDRFLLSEDSPYRSWDGLGRGGLPKAFCDEFISNDGMEDFRRRATMKIIDEIIMEDPEGGLTGITKKGLYGQSFFLGDKFRPRRNDFVPGMNQRRCNFTVMRYAEVLLMYAEAVINTGGNPDESLQYLNFLQQRAGSGTRTSSPNLDAIRSERKFELWMEGCRWLDIIRWNDQKALETLAKAGREVPTLMDKNTQAPQEGWVVETLGERWYIRKDTNAPDGGFKQGKHELFPFPSDAFAAYPDLKQNPGW